MIRYTKILASFYGFFYNKIVVVKLGVSKKHQNLIKISYDFTFTVVLTQSHNNCVHIDGKYRQMALIGSGI